MDSRLKRWHDLNGAIIAGPPKFEKKTLEEYAHEQTLSAWDPPTLRFSWVGLGHIALCFTKMFFFVMSVLWILLFASHGSHNCILQNAMYYLSCYELNDLYLTRSFE